MHDIPNYETFIKIEPISKGVSRDKKYFVETHDGKRMFLRIADIEEFDRKKAEYEMMERVHDYGVLCPTPYAFGLCDDGKSVYSISSWLDGIDADEAWIDMSEAERYELGIKSGQTLRKIHKLPAPDDAEPWNERFYRKVQSRIDFYDSNSLKSENGDTIIRFLQENKHLLDNRPQTFNHGDYNIVNLVVLPDGQVGVIDFNSYNQGYGDPWWEFNPINWGNELNVQFYNGFINGYFDNHPPHEFFVMLSYYIAYTSLAALCITAEGEEYVMPDYGEQCVEMVLRWFDGMRKPVPMWYEHK